MLKGNLWVHLTNLLSRKKQTNWYPGKKKGFKGYKTIQNSTLKSGPINFPFIYIYTPLLKGNLWVHFTNLLSRKKQINCQRYYWVYSNTNIGKAHLWVHSVAPKRCHRSKMRQYIQIIETKNPNTMQKNSKLKNKILPFLIHFPILFPT